MSLILTHLEYCCIYM